MREGRRPGSPVLAAAPATSCSGQIAWSVVASTRDRELRGHGQTRPFGGRSRPRRGNAGGRLPTHQPRGRRKSSAHVPPARLRAGGLAPHVDVSPHVGVAQGARGGRSVRWLC